MYSSAAVLNKQVLVLRKALVEATSPTIKSELLAKLGRAEAQAFVAERDAFLEQREQKRALNVEANNVRHNHVQHLFVSPDQQHFAMLAGA